MHNSLKKKKIYLLIVLLFTSLLFLLPSIKANAQKNTPTPKIVEVINADVLEVIAGEQVRKLIGNVELLQGDTRITCDSALLYYEKNNVDAFGNIHIQQGDSVHIRANLLNYDGNKRTARLKDNKNVYLTDGKSEIRSKNLIYTLNNRRAVLYYKVTLTDTTTNLIADSLTYFVATKRAHLNRNVHMNNRANNTQVTADSLYYSANTTEALLYGNVHMKDDKIKLKAPQMTYNVKQQKGYYEGGGQLDNKETHLTSQKGYYDAATRSVRFEENVHLISPQYDIQTTQLDYDMATENATFNGPTTIVGEQGTIITQAGTYNAKTESMDMTQRTTLQNPPQTITADRLNYDKKSGLGYAHGNVVLTDSEKNLLAYADQLTYNRQSGTANMKGNVSLIDTAQHLTIYSQYADFNQKTNRIQAYEKALLVNIVQNDTLFLSADTLLSYTQQQPKKNEKTAQNDSISNFYAYKNVVIFKSDMQGVCDSLAYSAADSLFSLFGSPILWLDSTQLNADTLRLHTTANNKPRLIELLRNAYIGNMVEPNVYNQVKGKNIIGYFADNNLDRLRVEGNAESIFYVQDDNKAYVGVNRASAAQMWAYFNGKKISKIKFEKNPDATLYPAAQINPRKMMLRGFSWQIDRRPMKRPPVSP